MAYLFQARLKEWGGGGLINLLKWGIILPFQTTRRCMVLILHKQLGRKVEVLKQATSVPAYE